MSRLHCLIASLLFPVLIAGCREKPKVEVKKPKEVREDHVALALLTAREATEAQQFRKVVELLNQNPDLAAEVKKLELPKEAETALKLEPGDIRALRAELLTPADAYYLEECFYFRDASKHLGLQSLDPEDRIRWGWQWVVRQVPLGDVYDERLPALYVVRRGLGTTDDRVRVASALFFQADLETALFTSKDSSQRWLGVRESKDVKPWTLIDLADGQALPISNSPEKMNEFKMQRRPDLQRSALRMKTLEQELRRRNEMVRLYQDLPLTPSNVDAASLRERLQFIPKEDGGLNPGFVLGKGPERWNSVQDFSEHRIPRVWGISELKRLGLVGPNTLPDAVVQQLVKLQNDLWVRWYLPPQQQLNRFQFDAASKHLSRATQILDDNDSNVRDAIAWRDRAVQAFVQNKLDPLWDEDKYLSQLLFADSELPLKKEQQKSLSRIILGSTRQPFQFQTHYLMARVAEEKAAALQMRLESLEHEKKPVDQLKPKTRDAWENALSHWESFHQSAGLRPNQLAERIRAARTMLADAREILIAIEFLELTHEQALLTWNARLRQAQAERQLGKTEAATKIHASLRDELGGASELAKVVEEAKGGLSAAPDPAVRSRYLNRVQQLLRNHQPGGAVDLLRKAAK